MIEQPGRYIESFREAGAEVITVHAEACRHLHRVIQQIKQSGAKAGVALNPHTNVHMIEDVLEDLDLVCIMSVNPGFGGQSFIPYIKDKISEARKIIDASGRDIRLEVDGGVKVDNIGELAALGADTFVAGSAIFNEPDYKSVIDAMRANIAAHA